MKNWKKWLVAGCMAALLGIGTMGTTAMAMGGGGVDRSEAVAEEEKVPSGKATQNSRVSSKAWKKINGVCYNGSGQKLEGAVTRGIDVSEWQDTINWSQVKKSNVDFAFVRISYGLNHLDKTYDYNMKQAEKAGIPTGTYVYSLALNTQQALKEAQLAIRKMDGYKVSYPVVYDIEYDQMRNLSKADIAILEANFTLLPQQLKILREQVSQDDLTRKVLLEFPDGNSVETVLMRHDYGYSVCVSSQVGCDMGCAFCASGLSGCIRNLTAAEILAQVYIFNSMLVGEGKQVSRIVVMGSGEPMLNFDAVIGALQFLHQENTLYMSYRNMTISTCGIIPGIEKLTQLGLPINLAISLHAAEPELRTELMPVNKGFPFQDVIQAAEAYVGYTGRQVTYEYILIAGKNDSPVAAELLANHLRFKHASVNLIPANPVPEKGFERPSKKVVEAFLKVLQKHKINATVRREMGKDIDAACGQLRARFAQEQQD